MEVQELRQENATLRGETVNTKESVDNINDILKNSYIEQCNDISYSAYKKSNQKMKTGEPQLLIRLYLF